MTYDKAEPNTELEKAELVTRKPRPFEVSAAPRRRPILHLKKHADGAKSLIG